MVPLQLTSSAPLGRGQGMHEVPQEFVLELEAQMPLQSWVPFGHWPAQLAASSMQAPWQSFFPWGQVAPHMPLPWQVAVPPVGVGQGVQEAPQLSGLVSLTQAPSQRW